MYNFNKIALTGATSTLGTAVIRECIKNDIEVLAFVNPNSVNKARIPVNKLVKCIDCALDQQEIFKTKGIEADVFIHFAWGWTNRVVRNDILPQVDNIKFAVEAVHLAKKLGCKKWIGAGSQAEYGIHSQALTEATPTHPVTAYGMAKLCAGQMTRFECKKANIEHIWPRILSTYGPNTQDTTIINYTINCLLHNKRPALSSCEQIWDFIYVDDAARAILMLADKGRDGEIYNVSSGKAKKMKDYIESIHNKINPDIEVGYGDLKNSGNIMYLQGDITKIKNDVGFEPDISFDKGIDMTIEWAREYYM